MNDIKLIDPQRITWRPGQRDRFTPPKITLDLNLREIDWHPAPEIKAHVEHVDGEDATKEWSYYFGSRS